MQKLKITLEDLFNMDSSTIYNPDVFKSSSYVSIDSRRLRKNSIFAAIKGSNFDGHDFVNDAISNGAGTVIINRRKINKFDRIDNTIVTVDSTVKSYGYLARVWRNRLNAKVISITGSTGKTTVKEMLSAILSEKFKVQKTIGNNNNHIGVPLTILSADQSHDVLVLEHGTNHFDEIKYTSEIALPDISVITNIGNSHLEYLIDHAGVYKEKSYLFESTLNNGGIIFINNDDAVIRKNTREIKNKITYGFKGKPDIKGKIISYTDLGYPVIEIKYKNRSLKTELPLLGYANAANFLTAVSIAQYLTVTKKQIINAAKNMKAADRRLNVKYYAHTTIVDDSYNSNPDSLRSSIESVIRMKNRKRKIILLGDMLELGSKSIKMHVDAADKLIKSKVDEVYTFGKYMSFLNKKLIRTKIKSRHFNNRRSLKSFLTKLNMKDSVVLIKGSRGMKMEEFTELLEDRL